VKLNVRHTIDCPPDRFWSLYFDPDFTRRLHLEGLGSMSVDIISQDGSPDAGFERTMRYGQRPDAPGPVRKLFGDEFVSTEVGSFDPAAGVWSFVLTPGTMADKTTITGRMQLTDNGDGTSEQDFTLEAKVKIIGVGGIVEKFIERQARDSQNKAAAFVNANLA